jgi:hypothetical protein
MSKSRNCAAPTALDSSPPLFVEDHKVVVRFRRSFGALIFALAAILAAAQPEPATAEDRGAIPLQARSGCIVGDRFTPGPIAGGHKFPNFKLGCVSCGNWSKAMLTAAGSPVGNEATTRRSPAG